METTLTNSQKNFIMEIGQDFGFSSLSDEQVHEAHRYAIDGSEQDYYYNLKHFFLNANRPGYPSIYATEY